MAVLYFAAIAAGAYFLGGLNGAIITSRIVYREDIRKHGSGNAGLTNFYRTYGGRAIFLLILIDVIKTALPVIAEGMILEGAFTFGTVEERVMIGRTWGGLFAIIGHAYPCLYGFKGGKGILAGGTMVLFLDLRVFLILLLLFVLAVLFTRYVSLGSIATGIALPIAFLALGMGLWPTLIAVLCAVFVTYCHRDNIARLLAGQERKFSLRKKREVDQS